MGVDFEQGVKMVNLSHDYREYEHANIQWISGKNLECHSFGYVGELPQNPIGGWVGTIVFRHRLSMLPYLLLVDFAFIILIAVCLYNLLPMWEGIHSGMSTIELMVCVSAVLLLVCILHLVYKIAKLTTERVYFVLSPESMDCQVTYLNRHKTYHFDVQSLRISRRMTRNRPYYHLAFKSQGANFLLDSLTPRESAVLETALCDYVDLSLEDSGKTDATDRTIILAWVLDDFYTKLIPNNSQS